MTDDTKTLLLYSRHWSVNYQKFVGTTLIKLWSHPPGLNDDAVSLIISNPISFLLICSSFLVSIHLENMAFFTTFFKQLLSRKERKSSISWSRSSRERKTTASDDSPSSNSSIITSSKEGHNFKYEGGRRYHAETDVAYILPNDDDGNHPIIITNNIRSTIIAAIKPLFYFLLCRGWSCSSATLDFEGCLTMVTQKKKRDHLKKRAYFVTTRI